MTKDNLNRLKLGGAIICIVLALGPLLPIYLISDGLLNNAVASDERTYFKIMLAVRISEVMVFGVLAIVLLKNRRS